MTFDELCNKAAKELPDSFTLVIEIEREAGVAYLLEDGDEEGIFDESGDRTMEEQVLWLLEEARGAGMINPDAPGLGDDIPCSKCGSALDTGLECTECGHDMRPEIYPEDSMPDALPSPDALQ